ncbi:MAG: 6-carboxytetrahydropterin synthase QueD [Candidatus Marinimicrobia bacterium]|nr:6-carboxytetrahydropterin synthase QueD [Candidatus Neomarinimicrobiota bacterium]
MKITKIIQWDMGHRILNHRSVCKGLHGHRYKAEITVEGDLVNASSTSEYGMVMDFADIKKIAKKEVHDKLDHGFMVWDKDEELINFFKNSGGHKMVKVTFTSTAENVAKYIFENISKKFEDKYGTGLKLSSVKLWETPTSYVVYEGRSC